MIQEIANLSTQLHNSSYDPQRIIQPIIGLRDDSCRAAAQVEQYVLNVKQLTDNKKRTLLTYGTALGLANGTAVAITMGAGAPFLALSSIVGRLLVTWRTTIEDPTAHPPR